jgi:DNA-binding NtrC family response regulator
VKELMWRSDFRNINMKILIVDDEESQRNILSDILSDAGYGVTCVSNGDEALDHIYKGKFQLILTDLKMPGKDGLELLSETLKFNPDIQVIIMTAFGTIPSAVNAIKTGAYDYLTKPFQKEDLLRIIKRAAGKVDLIEENRRLKNQIHQSYNYHNLIGRSEKMQEIFRQVERIKDTNATVLITGESGTGKELLARAIHYSGMRKNNPFVAINCGAIPENLIESELFGFEKGAFTGAQNRRFGKFEQAQGGTIFLDEISTMSMALQVKLLRVLQEKHLERVGGSKSIELDVRVIAATNENLIIKIEKNEFRPDLFHRLNVFTIHLPPLRERRQDIPLLTKYFIKKYCQEYQTGLKQLSSEALIRLENYPFWGNVRELQNIIEKTVLLTEEKIIKPEHLMISQPEIKIPISIENNSKKLPELEKDAICTALEQTQGSIKKASQALGISYKTLQYRIKKFGLNKKTYKI